MGSVRADGRLRFLIWRLNPFSVFGHFEILIGCEQRSPEIQHLLSCTIALERLQVAAAWRVGSQGVLKPYACRPDLFERKSIVRH